MEKQGIKVNSIECFNYYVVSRPFLRGLCGKLQVTSENDFHIISVRSSVCNFKIHSKKYSRIKTVTCMYRYSAAS